jgi:putative selenate reductase
MQKTELFSPISMKKLTSWILNELEKNKSIFGLPQEMFFTPSDNHPFKMKKYDCILETFLGVAAGPHTQMAQNIIISWLCGARFIELKTVQTRLMRGITVNGLRNSSLKNHFLNI